MIALLSFLLETWQSVQRLVSVVRTVCGKYGLNAVPCKSLGRDGLLLRINPLPIGVLRADEHGARRADRHDLAVLHARILAQHVHVVAQRLEVVVRVIARQQRLRCAAWAWLGWPSWAGGSRSSSCSTTCGMRSSSWRWSRGRASSRAFFVGSAASPGLAVVTNRVRARRGLGIRRVRASLFHRPFHLRVDRADSAPACRRLRRNGHRSSLRDANPVDAEPRCR